MARLIARQLLLVLVISIFDFSHCRKNSTSAVVVSKNQLTVCSNSVIKVTNITLLCDSPGTFYYGSGKYRNSLTCIPGDKAKVSVDFVITQSIATNNGEANVLVTVEADGGTGNDYSYTVYWNAPLCSVGGITLLNKTDYDCPGEGAYRISTSFSWDDNGDETPFTPTVSVGFKSNKNQEKFDLGGANTEYCSGKSETYISWTKYVQPKSADELPSFFWSLGILFGVVAVLGTFVYFLRRRQCRQWCYSGEEDPLLEVVDDTKKMQLFRSNKMLVDF